MLFRSNLRNCRKLRSWDLAATEDGGDWSVGALIIEDDDVGITYLADIVRFQKGPGETEAIVRAVAESDGADTEVFIEQEGGSAGKAVIDSYVRRVLKGFKASGRTPHANKWISSRPFYAASQNNLVRLVRGSWNAEFLTEFRGFPGGKHDDQIDAVAKGYLKLHEKRYAGVIWGRNAERATKGTTQLRTSHSSTIVQANVAQIAAVNASRTFTNELGSSHQRRKLTWGR